MIVCDKEDCPVYNCYFNPENYEPFKRKLKEYEKEIEKAPAKYSSDIKNNVASWMEQTNTKISITCVSCQHFNKLDIYSILLSEEAKSILTR